MTAKQDTHRAGPKRPTPKLSPRTLGIHQKQQRALELSAQGWTHDQISRELGYTERSSVTKAIRAVLARVEGASVDQLRAVQNEQIRQATGVVFEILGRQLPAVVVPEGMDDGETRLWAERIAQAVEDRQFLRLRAVDRLVRLADRSSKLNGLDAPVQTEIMGDGSISVVFAPAMMPAPRRQVENS